MRLAFSLTLVLLSAGGLYTQVPLDVGVQILKAEDSRRYDTVLENLMRSPSAAVRERAALAAGRIGDDRAVPALTALLETGPSPSIRATAAFAIGEVESIKGADAVLAGLKREITTSPPGDNADPMARLVEAAGKIAAANPKDAKAKELATAILAVLKSEPKDRLTVLLALTAALRAKPEGVGPVVAEFVTHPDVGIRAAALNTLARLRLKERLAEIRNLIAHDPDPIVRANAARAAGAAEDRDAAAALVNAATKDADTRVRVSAIRALGSIKDQKVAVQLIEHGESLLAAAKRSRYKRPSELAEMIEVATVLGRSLTATKNERAVKFLDQLAVLDNGMNAAISVARVRIAPSGDFDNSRSARTITWHELSTDAEVLGEFADLDPKVYGDTPELRKLKSEGPDLLFALLAVTREMGQGDDGKDIQAMPDVLSAYAKYKTESLDEVLRLCLERDDVILRATAAGLIAERPATTANVAALREAFSAAFVKDKHDNDAVLAIIDALYKLDKKGSVGSLLVALSSPDYLVRKKAFELLADPELQKVSPGIATSLESARLKHRDQVLPYSPAAGTRLGQVLNLDTDYRRALARKDGSVRAVVTTEKGVFRIIFAPEEAPLTVDNFVKLARVGYFNGLEVHRVVPNFVMQDGDPRGDGNGGPGWSIRCEINMLPYDRGAVGMALSGKDTGGSQWFVTHSPQPHLDGGYTVFGHVAEADMKVVDSIVRGDKILSVKIVEQGARQRPVRRTRR